MSKKQAISLEKKLKILAEVNKGRKKMEIASEFGIPPSTLSTIIKNNAAICEAAESGQSGSRKRQRTSTHMDVDEALLRWFTQMRSQSLAVDGPLLMEKAKALSIELGVPDFKFGRWKDRHGIRLRAVCGEAADVDTEAVDNWRLTVLPQLLSPYEEKDIFNADESGLFWRMLPDRTFYFNRKSCTGGKQAKDRITVLLATNMTGTSKLKPLVLGKAKNPRCFRGIKHIPVHYRANKKAWLTGDLWEEWIRKVDKSMRNLGRHILLLIDNCPAHKNVHDLTNVKVQYLPPNTTAVLQPCDQGIIQATKRRYRSRLLKRTLAAYESGMLPEINLREAMDMLSAAWNDVTEETISNCWRHSGIVKNAPPVDNSPNQVDDSSMDNIFDRLRHFMNIPDTVDPEVYLHADDAVAVTGLLSDSEIAAEVHQKKEDDKSDSEDDSPVPVLPSAKDVINQLNEIRIFLQCQDGDITAALHALGVIENYAQKSVIRNSIQTNITDYFQRI